MFVTVAIMREPNTSRTRLAAVLLATGDLVTVDVVVNALHVSRPIAARTLARWEKQHWLKRLRRGLYAPIPLALGPNEQVFEDPWALVPELFGPGYVGGASAAHHWDLTEQLLRTVFVYTTRMLRRTEHIIQGIVFEAKHVNQSRIYGTETLWRGRTKIQISDVHRTIVDLLDDPASGGGIRHVEDCFLAYLERKDADLKRLIEYGERLGNGAVFKRLGFLGERRGAPKPFLAACSERLTPGNAKLDPSLESPRLVRRWRLWVPEIWKEPIA